MGAGSDGADARRWFSSLSRGIKWLIGAVVALGGVATAIGAIVALWPDPPAELRAEISDVSVDRSVTLEEFALRSETGIASLSASARSLRLTAYTHAQVGTDGETLAPDGATTPGGTTTTEDTTTTEQTTTDDTTAPTDDDEELDGDVVQERPLSGEESELLNDGLKLAMSAPAVSPTDVGETCGADLSDPDCGLRSTADYLLSRQSDVSAATVATQLVTLFDGVRKQPPPPDEGQPVGVTVTFNVSLTGFRGRTAEVRFSVYDAGGGGRLSPDWYRSQTVLLLEGEAEEDSGGGEFWVPLPRETGSYFVRFGVYDEDDDRLDYEDTPTVR